MTFGNRLQTITQDTILPKVVDQSLPDSFMAYRYVSNGKKWSGTTLNVSIKVLKNTLGRSFSGLASLNTGQVDTRIQLSYDPRAYSIPVSIGGIEEAVNDVAESQVVALVKTEVESTIMDGMDQVAEMLYADGTGNTNQDFVGLDALNDDGTSAATIGGQSRSTYTVLQGKRTASGGTLSVGKLGTLTSNVSGGSVQTPTIYTGSKTEFDLYEQLLSPTVRANYEIGGLPKVTRSSKGVISASEAKGGFNALLFRGTPLIADEKAPTGTIWAINENFIMWYGIKSKRLQQISLTHEAVDSLASDLPSQDMGFQWTGWRDPYNQFGMTAHFFLLGNMITTQPRRQGRLTGITSV